MSWWEAEPSWGEMAAIFFFVGTVVWGFIWVLQAYSTERSESSESTKTRCGYCGLIVPETFMRTVARCGILAHDRDDPPVEACAHCLEGEDYPKGGEKKNGTS